MEGGWKRKDTIDQEPFVKETANLLNKGKSTNIYNAQSIREGDGKREPTRGSGPATQKGEGVDCTVSRTQTGGTQTEGVTQARLPLGKGGDGIGTTK